MLQDFLGTLRQICALTQSCLGTPLTPWLGFFTVNCGTLYRQVCAFPNHVQSIEFTTSGLQSSCRNILRMINGSRMHLSSISSLIAKGLNSYVNKIFVFLNLQNIFLLVFVLSLWVIVFRLMWNFVYLIHFTISNITKCGTCQGV